MHQRCQRRWPHIHWPGRARMNASNCRWMAAVVSTRSVSRSALRCTGTSTTSASKVAPLFPRDNASKDRHVASPRKQGWKDGRGGRATKERHGWPREITQIGHDRHRAAFATILSSLRAVSGPLL